MTNTHETLREAVARAMRLSAPELQSGQVWEYVTVKQSQVMADAAIATIFDRLLEPALDALTAAYDQGATDVHNAWVAGVNGGEPDFYEAARDYAASVNLPAALQQGNNQ